MSGDNSIKRTHNGDFYPAYEFYKQLQDYQKVLITVNSATILVMITFLEKIFPSPMLTVLIPIAFFCFAISLTASLLMMTFISEYLGLVIQVSNIHHDISSSGQSKSEDIGTNIKRFDKDCNILLKKQKIVYPIGTFSYLIGITILVIFFTANYLR